MTHQRVREAPKERKTILLKDEEDAWSILEEGFKEQKIPEVITYGKWLNYNFKLDIGHHQAITPSLMNGYQELQTEIYRVFALIKYDSDEPNHLKQEERKKLEIAVQVKKGSSDYSIINLPEIANTIQAAINHMSPEHTYYVALAIVLLLFSNSSIRALLQFFLDQRRMELRSKERMAKLRQLVIASKEETKRLVLLEKIAKENKIANQALEASKKIQRQFMRALSRSKAAVYMGIDIDPAVAYELAMDGIGEESQSRLDGPFYIKSIDASKPDVFRAKLESPDGEQQVTAELANDMFALDSGEKIMDAFKERRSMDFKLNVEKIAGKIERGHIVDAKAIPHHKAIPHLKAKKGKRKK